MGCENETSENTTQSSVFSEEEARLWKEDSWGCLNQRMKLFKKLEQQGVRLERLIKNEILAIFGNPDKANENMISYSVVNCNPHCKNKEEGCEGKYLYFEFSREDSVDFVGMLLE